MQYHNDLLLKQEIKKIACPGSLYNNNYNNIVINKFTQRLI